MASAGASDLFSQAFKILAVPSQADGDGQDITGSGTPTATRAGSSQELKRGRRTGKTAPRGRDGGVGKGSGKGSDAGGASQSLWVSVEDYFRGVVEEDLELVKPFSAAELESLLVDLPLGLSCQERVVDDDKGGRDALAAKSREGSARVKRKLLRASPVNKKRKLDYSNSTAFPLLTTIISPQESEDDELCHVCWGGDSYEKNQILFCDSCNVAVHQECYGVAEVPAGSWICSGCQVGPPGTVECVLCPLKGGALKPVAAEVNSEQSHPNKRQYAHLFCSQWIPETFIQSVESMEPVCNVGGIRKERWRLNCTVCRDKHGACIQCAHGLCAAAFHPLCARGAKLRMEVSSREGIDEVEMRAYCMKHSNSRVGRELNFVERSASALAVESHVVKPEETHSLGTEGVEEKNSATPNGQEIEFEEEDSSSQWRLEALSIKSQHQAASTDDLTSSLLTSSSQAELVELVKQVMDRTQTAESVVAANSGVCKSMLSSWLLGKNLPNQDAINIKIKTYLRGRVHSILSRESSAPLHTSHSNASGRTSSSDNSMGVKGGESPNSIICKARVNDFSGPHDALGAIQPGKEAEMDKCLSNGDTLPSSLGQIPMSVSCIAGSTSQGSMEGRMNSTSLQCGGEEVNGESGLSIVSRDLVPGRVLAERPSKLSKAGRGGEISGDDSDSRRVKTRAQPQAPVLSSHGEIGSCGTMEDKSGKRNGLLTSGGTFHPYIQRQLRLRKGEQRSVADYLELCQDDNQGDREISKISRVPLPEGKQEHGESGVEMLFQPSTSTAQLKGEKDLKQKVCNESSVRSATPTASVCALCGSHFETVSKFREHKKKCQDVPSRTEAGRDAGRGSERKSNVSHFSANELEGIEDDPHLQLKQAREMGLLELAPEDELEAELLILQNQMLWSARDNRARAEHLMQRVLASISDERLAELKRTQDRNLVAVYMAQQREIKKQGRKDKKDKEAQALLAAATAAVASSPRVGAHFRRETGPSTLAGQDEAALATPISTTSQTPLLLVPPVQPGAVAGQEGPQSSIHVPKPPHSKPPRLQSLASSPAVSLSSPAPTARRRGSGAGSKEDANAVCSICGNGTSETRNVIVFCERCSVPVHQDCYGIASVPSGPWLCQPCVHFHKLAAETREPVAPPEADSCGLLQPGVKCRICPLLVGAFKRSYAGDWAHVLCAQWMPESNVDRDQGGFIEGLENMAAERCNLRCVVCLDSYGACSTCNFGHCSATFHPSCARSKGFLLSVKPGPGGRHQFRAYCDRHSPMQRAKVESKTRGSPTDLAKLRTCRMEFERLRLICERVVRREKKKRELVLCLTDVTTAQLSSAGDPHLSVPSAAAATPRTAPMDGKKLTRLIIREPSQSVPSDHGGGGGGRGGREGDSGEGGEGGVVASVRSKSPWQGGRASGWMLPNGGAMEDKKREWQVGIMAMPHNNRPGARGVASRQIREASRQQKLSQHSERLLTPYEASLQNKNLPKGYAYIPVHELPVVSRSQELSRNNLPGLPSHGHTHS